MRTRLTTVFVSVSLAVAAMSGATAAHAVTPSLKAAKAAALAKARQIARETHASASRVLTCKRSSRTRYVCQVENRFTSGATRCTAQVVVRFVSGRTRTSYSNYICY